MKELGLLTRREACEVLRVSLRHLWGLSSPRGPLPVVKIGGRILYKIADLEAFVTANTLKGVPQTTGGTLRRKPR